MMNRRGGVHKALINESTPRKRLAECKGFALGPRSKSPLVLCMMAESHLNFFSIQTHILKQRPSLGPGT